ncbi:MAG: nucleotidyltransferase [Ignavibacteria bacterium GWB2_35_12]|nr:MAG: nucleotidyltransferase [Ignavibacteria bacterium GWA2_35_8]OGU41070.1 MAG: nucleotidyltransferase [Ignavibacteria bacterium GWB2_35_12]OGU96487.1 MAG: nucleotidyltransferase [Ignavibacteria bacterium RIFOXYA2_FULL_35_10]
MVEIPDQILNKINLYLDELNKNNIKVRKAILFGSYAKGNYNEWSDIDLAIVSDDFEGLRYNDLDKIRKFNAVTNWEISPLPYNSETFDINDIFIKEIIETGIPILDN